MFSRAFAAVTLSGALLASACTSAADQPPPAASGNVASADAAFVQEMLTYHRHNLAVLTLAADRAADAQVKDLAAQSARIQRLQETTMTTLLIGWTQPTAAATREPDGHQQELAVLTGAAFDRGLVAAMISHNEDAARIARQALAGVLSDRTRRIATAVDTGMATEIAALRQIQNRLEGGGANP